MDGQYGITTEWVKKYNQLLTIRRYYFLKLIGVIYEQTRQNLFVQNHPVIFVTKEIFSQSYLKSAETNGIAISIKCIKMTLSPARESFL
jgi:hypothetical protein